MDYWKEVYDIADIVLENSWMMWLVYISFFIMAVVVRKKKDNRTRRVTGSIMIGASLPGLLISAGCLGLFIHVMVQVMKIMASKEYRHISDSPVIRDLDNLCNSVPITCLCFSMLLFPILALIAFICGIVILAKRAGKGTGVVMLMYGFVVTGFTVWLMMGMFAYFAS